MHGATYFAWHVAQVLPYIAWILLDGDLHPIFSDFYHEWTLLSMMQCQTLICWAHLRCVAAWLQVGEHPQLPHRPVGHLILLGLWRDLAWKHDAKQKGLDFHVNLNPTPPEMSWESRIFIRKQSLLGDPNCTGEHRHLSKWNANLKWMLHIMDNCHGLF